MHICIRNKSTTKIRNEIIGYRIKKLRQRCEHRSPHLTENTALKNTTELRRNRIQPQTLSFRIDRCPNAGTVSLSCGNNRGIRRSWKNGINGPGGLHAAENNRSCARDVVCEPPKISVRVYNLVDRIGRLSNDAAGRVTGKGAIHGTRTWVRKNTLVAGAAA